MTHVTKLAACEIQCQGQKLINYVTVVSHCISVLSIKR